MKKKENNQLFLLILAILNMFVLLHALKKPPIKDWLIVVFSNAITNGIIDKILTKRKIIRYPVRLFSKYTTIHLIFDYLIYPTFMVKYNQMTKNDPLLIIVLKLLLFTTPMFLIEYWAERKTNLIKWGKGWSFYYTIITVLCKSLFNRAFIGWVRRMDKKQHTI